MTTNRASAPRQEEKRGRPYRVWNRQQEIKTE